MRRGMSRFATSGRCCGMRMSTMVMGAILLTVFFAVTSRPAHPVRVADDDLPWRRDVPEKALDDHLAVEGPAAKDAAAPAAQPAGMGQAEVEAQRDHHPVGLAGRSSIPRPPAGMPAVPSDATGGRLHLAVTMCNDRGAEAVNMLKSATLFSSQPLMFHVFHADGNDKLVEMELATWPDVQSGRVAYRLYEVHLEPEWRKLFKPCAVQRLFFPDLIADVERLVYLDSDTLLLEDPGHLWAFFKEFNTSTITAVSAEGERGGGWYDRFSRHPFFGTLGINSAVMFMDLKRMRSFDWVGKVKHYYDMYRGALTWGDQDLINTILGIHPDVVKIIPCRWNYRADQCRYGNNCDNAKQDGIALMHCSRSCFHNDDHPIFPATYNAVQSYDWSLGFHQGLFVPLEKTLTELLSGKTSCHEAAEYVIKNLRFADPTFPDQATSTRDYHTGGQDPKRQGYSPPPRGEYPKRG